jgi:hypothetical protein
VKKKTKASLSAAASKSAPKKAKKAIRKIAAAPRVSPASAPKASAAPRPKRAPVGVEPITEGPYANKGPEYEARVRAGAASEGGTPVMRSPGAVTL